MEKELIRVNNKIVGVPIILQPGAINPNKKLFLDPYPYLKTLRIKAISYSGNSDYFSQPQDIQDAALLTVVDKYKQIRLYQYPISDLWDGYLDGAGLYDKFLRLRFFDIDGIDTQASYLQFTALRTAGGQPPIGFLYFHS
jgi:hypothetical protein